MDRRVSSLTALIDDPAFQQGRTSLVLLFSGFDCSSCVAKGFDLIMALEKKHVEIPVFVVGSGVGMGSAQLQYGYEKYFYIDTKDAVRKELQFVQSPVVLLLDGDFRIQALYFPLISGDEKARSAFEKHAQQFVSIP